MKIQNHFIRLGNKLWSEDNTRWIMVLVTMTLYFKIWPCMVRYLVPDYPTVRSVVAKILVSLPILTLLDYIIRPLNHPYLTVETASGGISVYMFPLMRKCML